MARNARHHIDKEVQTFRDVMPVPSTFEDGFRWSSLLGAIFVALVMVPGAIYMGLLAGVGIGPAAQWVTVILFIEVARRAHRHLSKSEIFVLYFMAGAMMTGLGIGVQGGRMTGLLWRQYFAVSDAARSSGITEHLPEWYAPAPESDSYAVRSFLHPEWLAPIGLLVFGTFFGQIANLVLGYGLFRLTSDIEKLPFPLAPVGAQGILAVAEDVEEKERKDSEHSWRWRVFGIGGALGLVFGAVYLLLPTLTGALTTRSVQIFPIPFSDFTHHTGHYLPAVATGISWDFGHLIFGMVMPFFGMVGSFIGLIVTVVANPILYHVGLLNSWTSGDDTVWTLFKNNVDFYFSFQIGIGIAIALVGILQVVRSLRRAKADKKSGISTAPPPGRGDIRGIFVVLCYFVVTAVYIAASLALLVWDEGGWNDNVQRVFYVLLGLGLVYTPLISYVTARLEGMVGQVVEIPMIRQGAMILSGYRGVACWFLPLPVANYGRMTVFYRQCELTGTKFTSIWKAKVILYPIILISSIMFMNFIWKLDQIPSSAYPYAQKMWKLQAANECIMLSSTLGDYSMFEEAFNWMNLGAGTVFGALIGRFYFQKRLGLKWRQYIPVVAAGFSCGMGLITTLGVGITFLSKAVIKLPF